VLESSSWTSDEIELIKQGKPILLCKQLVLNCMLNYSWHLMVKLAVWLFQLLDIVCECNAVVTCDIILFQKLFQPSSMSDWNNFISAHGTLPEINLEAYCSSWISSDAVFSVAEIISAAEIILFRFHTWVTCEIKRWINSEIVSVFYFTCNHSLQVK